MQIIKAETKDIKELYQLQLLAFESEAAMIGSRDVPALQETEAEYRADFANWQTLKLENEFGEIIGAIRYKLNGQIAEIGRLMVHPAYRHRGLAQKLLSEADRMCPNTTKELYTCTKSRSNILLYQKMGYTPYKEHTEKTGLSFVHMRKD